jgi:hypothetical protein
MPISIGKVSKKTRKVTVDLGDGDTFDAVYRPGVYTAEFEREIQQKATDEEYNVVGQMVEQLVEDWDVYEDDDQKKKVPLTAKRLGSISVLVLAPLLKAINEDIRPGKKTGGSFSGG